MNRAILTGSVITGIAIMFSIGVIGPAFAAPASTTTTSQIIPFDLEEFVPCADGGRGRDYSALCGGGDDAGSREDGAGAGGM